MSQIQRRDRPQLSMTTSNCTMCRRERERERGQARCLPRRRTQTLARNGGPRSHRALAWEM